MSERGGTDAWAWIFAVMGLLSLGNGVWMLVEPLHWYHELPAGVPDFGAFNPHFVRDIGCAFVTVGAALVWAGFAPRFRLPLVGTASVFYVAHALLHVYDTTRGAVDAHHWLLDLPGVYLPAVLLVVVSVRLARREGEASHAT
jgi:hypothetical protein